MQMGRDIFTCGRVVMAMLAMTLCLSSPVAGQMLQLRRPSVERPGNPMSLVPLNEDQDNWLTQADQLVKDGNLAEAVRAYQALVVRGEQMVHRVSPRQFISISSVAADRIAGLPEEGLKLYRTLYDPQAQELFEQARQSLDRSSLRRVVLHYFHTSYGDRALDLLADLQFDAGRFVEAGKSWQAVLDRKDAPAVPREVVLAKAAIACHLAGLSPTRDGHLAELKEKFPQAVAVLAGREQNVLAFALAACQAPGPDWLALGPTAMDNWPSLAGSPDGLAIMPDCNVVLTARWHQPDFSKPGRADGDVSDLPELRSMLVGRLGGAEDGGSMAIQKVELRDGRLRATGSLGGGGAQVNIILPPILYLVAVKDQIITRHRNQVIARDVVTGRLLWQSLDLPMERLVPGAPGMGFSPDFPLVGDLGRYGLTVADDLVLTVGEFPPPAPPFMLQANPRLAKDYADTSKLVALSISRQGKLMWELGQGLGGDEVLAGGSFLCAPTYADGRLYAVVKYTEAFYLVCLDPAGGSLIWKAMIGQAPPASMRYGSLLTQLGSRGSPPAVAGGRVFVTTNAGLLAAFSADTGQVLWVYQYESDPFVNSRRGAITTVGTDSPQAKEVKAVPCPPNPLLVTQSAVIALPADSEEVLALSVTDGAMLWRRRADADGARGLMSLSALPGFGERSQDQGPGTKEQGKEEASSLPGTAPADAAVSIRNGDRPSSTAPAAAVSIRNSQSAIRNGGCILLSGPGLSVLRADNGQPVWRYSGPEDLFGRPAVTRSTILISGVGQILAVHMDGPEPFRVEKMALKGSDSVLGNLVSMGDKLLAGNCGIVCLYMGYDEAYRSLTQRMEQEPGQAAKDDLQFERGLMAMQSGQLNQALTDLQALHEIAYKSTAENAAALQQRVDQALGNLFIQRGNQAGSDAEMGQMFQTAQTYAKTPAGRAEMLVRFIRYYERLHRLPQAAAAAQSVASDFAEVTIRDVEIGPQAGDPADTRNQKAEPGRVIAQRHIARLVELYGEDVYAAFDAKARTALEQGLAKKDAAALRAAWQMYPRSKWAADLLFAAAEILYNQTIATPASASLADPRADEEKLYEAYDLLANLRNYADSPLGPSGLAGQALIQMRLNPNLAMVIDLPNFRSMEKGTRVKFGDFDGRVDELIARISAGQTTQGASRAKFPTRLTVPLEQIYRVDDASLEIIRDSNGQPVRLGPLLMLLQGEAQGAAVVCLDTRAGQFVQGKGIRWKTTTNIDRKALSPTLTNQRRLVGHLVGDSQLALATRDRLVVMDTQDGRLVRQMDLASLGIHNVDTIAADGEFMIFVRTDIGQIACVDLRTGKLAWKSAPPDAGRMALVIQAAGGMVLSMDSQLRWVRCYDLKSGKLVLNLQGTQHCEAILTPEGMVVVLKDQELSLYDSRHAKSPIFSRPMAGSAAILGASSRYAALRAGRTAVVADLARRGEPVAKVSPQGGSAEHSPVIATIEGDRMYMLCSQFPRNQMTSVLSGPVDVHKPVVQAVDLTSGEPLWSVSVGAGRNVPGRLGPITLTESHVPVMIRSMSIQQGGQWFLLDKSTGKVVQSGEQAGTSINKAEPAGSRVNRHLGLGSLAITNGRMVIEEDDGICVMGQASASSAQSGGKP